MSDDILRPKVIVVPVCNPATLTTAEIGSMVISGGKLFFAASKGSFELVTSGAF